jgi:hypothetical protein
LPKLPAVRVKHVFFEPVPQLALHEHPGAAGPPVEK